jgi:hypothetical protein
VPVLTMTLPPEYHRNPDHGGRSWNPALSPVRGAAELQDRWHRMLARARKAGVLGLSTLEPHRDGAPHRHAMVWLRPEHQARFSPSYATNSMLPAFRIFGSNNCRHRWWEHLF